MKKIFFLLGLFLSTVLAEAHPGSMQKKLTMPEKIYAVAGIECNLYFRQVFMTINPANFAFYVKCKKGRSDEKRWTYTPKKDDAGTYDLVLEVHNDDGIVAQGRTQLVVVPADAGKGKSISMLIMGSSTIHMRHAIPRHIHTLFKAPGNPALTLIGENGPHWPDKAPGEIRHEGYGGWSFMSFVVRGRVNKKKPAIAYHRSNPFWNSKTNALDFGAYLTKNNKGKAPDYILIALGGNDVFSCTDTNIDSRLKLIRTRMNTLFGAIRKTAFGSDYGCKGFRWQVKKNFAKFRLLVDDVVKNSKDPNLVKVDATHAFDCENNVPVHKRFVNGRNRQITARQSNALHPTDAGYNQIADTIYAWIKADLNFRKKTK